jgi:hypothetical protein
VPRDLDEDYHAEPGTAGALSDVAPESDGTESEHEGIEEWALAVEADHHAVRRAHIGGAPAMPLRRDMLALLPAVSFTVDYRGRTLCAYPTDAPDKPMLGKLEYRKRHTDLGPSSVHVQCKHKQHKMCRKWVNTKDVPVQVALFAWILLQHAHPDSDKHLAAFQDVLDSYRTAARA